MSLYRFPTVLNDDGLKLLRRTRSDDYEFRPVTFLHFSCRTPFRLDIGPEWDAVRRAACHRMAYEVESDCELQAHEDRANREDCWRDWWRADWIAPELECQCCDGRGTRDEGRQCRTCLGAGWVEAEDPCALDTLRPFGQP